MAVVRVVVILLRAFLFQRAALAAENLALRHQLAVLQVSAKRPRLTRRDRIFWVWLSRLWSGCPMRAAACCWAEVRRIVYGVSIPWLAKRGWRQIALRATDVFAAARQPVELAGSVLEDECARLFTAAR